MGISLHYRFNCRGQDLFFFSFFIHNKSGCMVTVKYGCKGTYLPSVDGHVIVT